MKHEKTLIVLREGSVMIDCVGLERQLIYVCMYAYWLQPVLLKLRIAKYKFQLAFWTQFLAHGYIPATTL